jgi:hypothetical protein
VSFGLKQGKYVPRSLQDVFDRLETRNERIDRESTSTDLPTTFEVIIYNSYSPDLRGKKSEESIDESSSISNYNLMRARSLAGHHDSIFKPESASTIDQYERIRNIHFQAVIKKSTDIQTPQTGEVWLATLVGGNVVSLSSKVGEVSIFLELDDEDGPARAAYSRPTEPVGTVGDTTAPTSDEEPNFMARNKKSRDVLKDQLKRLFAAEGIPFTVTSEVRNIDRQVRVLKGIYNNQGREELATKYGNPGLGKKMVDAIESGDETALKVAAQKSTRHLRGLAIDIRTWDKNADQINKAIEIIKGLGLTYILEPVKTGCWDKPGSNVQNVKRLASPGGLKGAPCYAEHIHINVPEGYGE